MKFFVIVLNDIVKTFSVVGRGINCTYSFTYKNALASFKDANPDDRVIGYIDSPTDRFSYIFEIEKKIDDKTCVLRKLLETEKGMTLSDVPYEVSNLIISNKSTNLFLEIAEDTYNRLVRKMLGESTKEYLSYITEGARPIKYKTGYKDERKRNRIVFGAPGTGKSFQLNNEKDDLLKGNPDGYERVTFHPDYTYGSFVGTYKPVPCLDSEGKDAITYKYVPGPFMRVLVKALKSSKTDTPMPFLLLIEEINRADVASVFGDVFQLLDRNKTFYSEYPIQTSEDIRHYLSENLGGNDEDYAEIRIPDNMFIWATMNSADQGVFPMDTAFKRRWDFTYLGINNNDSDIEKYTVQLPNGKIYWNKLRKAINAQLSSMRINEDKLLGPFFIKPESIDKVAGEDYEFDATKFMEVFKNKVIMYLFEDAAKRRPSDIFVPNGDGNAFLYSDICNRFEKVGTKIFVDAISNVDISAPTSAVTTGNDTKDNDK